MLKKALVAAGAVAIVLGTGGLAQAASSLNIVTGPTVSIPAAQGTFAGSAATAVSCPAGQVLTGGGANVTAGNSNLKNYNLVSSIPINGTTWWAFGTNNDPTAAGKITAYAVCAQLTDLTAVTAP
jgi:hypothetical protein